MATDEIVQQQRWREELVRARCARDVAYAQYPRALTRPSRSAEQSCSTTAGRQFQ